MWSKAPRLATFLAVFAVAAALPAGAQVLYKWIDADGKVQYSDRPPKAFKGPVTRIEPDYDRNPPAAPSKPASLPVEVRKDAVEPVRDLATRRRMTRETLGARLTQARDNLEAAKKALSEAEPEPDERQVIQQRMAVGALKGMAPRSNCSLEVDKAGRKSVMCPALVAGAAFHDRVAKLEDAVALAEEELANAERAWRQGVD